MFANLLSLILIKLYIFLRKCFYFFFFFKKKKKKKKHDSYMKEIDYSRSSTNL